MLILQYKEDRTEDGDEKGNNGEPDDLGALRSKVPGCPGGEVTAWAVGPGGPCSEQQCGLWIPPL